MSNITDTILPSIRNRAVLVSISFSKPKMTQLDKKATHDAEVANNAHGALKTVKLLYPESLIKPIVAKEAEIRGYVRSKTVPWGDTGMGLLDTRRYFEFATQINVFKIEHRQMVTVFAQNYSNVLAAAAQQQGDLFDASVYPDASEVVEQFTMKLNFMPVGDISGGLFDEVEAELKDALTEQVAETTKALVSDVISDPFKRIIESVLNIYDKTVREDGVIRDSLMGNLEELVESMPALNVLDIPQLNRLTDMCKKRVLAPAEALRGGSQKRLDVAQAASEIIKAVGLNPDDAKGTSIQDRREMAEASADAILQKMGKYF